MKYFIEFSSKEAAESWVANIDSLLGYPNEETKTDTFSKVDESDNKDGTYFCTIDPLSFPFETLKDIYTKDQMITRQKISQKYVEEFDLKEAEDLKDKEISL